MGDSRQASTPPARPADVLGGEGAHAETGRRERSRLIQQVTVAIACAAAITTVAWNRVGDQLSLRTDIVGNTIFSDIDIYRVLDHFYILVVLLPGLAAALFLLITRWGPLSSRGSRAAWPPALVVAAVVSQNASSGLASSDGNGPGRPANAGGVQRASRAQLIGVAARLALPALVIAAEAEIGRSPQGGTLNLPLGIAALAAYAGVAAAIAMTLDRWYHQGLNVWSAANAVLATAVVPLLLLVSASTTVSVASDHRVVHYAWLPVWLALLAVLLALALIVVGLRRGGWLAAPRVERWALVAVVGPVAVFLVTAALQGPLASFIGYDDAMSMTGAQLLFGHGLWPWRDVFLLHGFLLDALYGQVGMWAFGATAWGSGSGVTFFVAPLTVISLYAFIVYFARRNYTLVLGSCLAVILGLLVSWPGTRFLLLPPLLILFDLVLRRATWGRCWAFMAVAFLNCIVTPESALLVLGVLATLPLAELTHHRWGEPLRQGFCRAFRCCVAGAALTAVWVVFLLATGGLSGFVNFYLAVTAGHELWGALPLGVPPATSVINFEFALPLALFLLTVIRIVWKLQQRSSWRTVDWVLIASATFVPLYYAEALDRLDQPHVNALFQALVPMVLLWAYDFIGAVDAWFLRAVPRIRTEWRRLRAGPAGHDARSSHSIWPRSSVTAGAVVATLCIVLVSPQSLGALADLPGNFHAAAPAEAPAGLSLGYTDPGAVDTAQLQDLATVLDRYAGPTAPVFDFTNEPGVTFFLLNRVPAAPFYHVGAAETAAAQRLDIAALERTRPPVAIFNDTTFGLPDYDGIWSMERDYLISQYLLDNYTPILDVQGQLIMLRDDLVSLAPPPPALLVPPITTDLYFAAGVPACDWGDIPDFLDAPASSEIDAGQAVTTTPSGQVATSASGWAFDVGADRPPVAVLAVADGIVVAETQPTGSRPDVAAVLHNSAATVSGWALGVVSTSSTALTFYALNANGTVSPIPSTSTGPAPSTIRTGQGTVYSVVASPDSGHVDAIQSGAVVTMSLPGSASLSTYEWLEFVSPSGFGQANIEVTDQTLGAQPSHVIGFQTLPLVGHTVYLRVGSCIQWHGYQAGNLHLIVQGAPSDMSVRLLP